MKKMKKIWIYSFVIIGVALMISTSCKKKADNPAAPLPQVPVFTVTSDSVLLQTGGAGLQFVGKCTNENVKMTRVTITSPISVHASTYLLYGNSFAKNIPFAMQDDNTAYNKELGTWNFIFVGNRTSDNVSFSVNATLLIKAK